MANAATNILVAARNFIMGERGWKGRLKKKGNKVSGRGSSFENSMFGLLTPVGAKFNDVFVTSRDDSPPEGFIWMGPAAEFKHDMDYASKIQLSSSDPFARLKRDDLRLSSLMRDSNDWPESGEREIIYVVGNLESPKVYKHDSKTGGKKGERKTGSGIVIMVYGDLLTGEDFRARMEWERSSRAFMEAKAIELGLPYTLDTNELFCLKDTDGMGAQQRSRRMQSMWHPLKRFYQILSQDPDFLKPVPLLFGILRTETYDALPQADKDILEQHVATGDFYIKDAETEIVLANPEDTVCPPYTRITKTVQIKVFRARRRLDI